jgi:nitrogen fixation/metabolism regulation signal transduction histidine kinase
MPGVAQATTAGKPLSRFENLEAGGEVLRSINPVPNRAPCLPCHGTVAANPVNGVLVIDYDAAPIRDSARRSAALFLLAGSAVLGLTLATLWLALRRQVIRPLADLDAAARALATGDLSVRAVVTRDDEIGRAADSFNRMAGRLEAQMALVRAHEAWLQEILDGLPDGVRVIRVADKKVVLANRAFCQQTGRPLEEILGSSLPQQQPCPCRALCGYPGDLSAGRVAGGRRDPQGQPPPPARRWRPVPGRSQRRPGRDRQGGGGERYIVESVRDLGQAARVSHEQRLSELGLLAAGIAHEIHNPLGSVRLGVQGLAREIREARITPEQIAEYMGLIDQEIDNCIAVTRRLLLLARPPSNSLQLVVLGEALTDTLRLLEFDAQGRNIRQQIEVATRRNLRVLADEAEIRMIFLNLVQNAHHAMPEGGTLTARVSEDRGAGADRDCRYRNRHGPGTCRKDFRSLLQPPRRRSRRDGPGPDHRQELRRTHGR